MAHIHRSGWESCINTKSVLTFSTRQSIHPWFVCALFSSVYASSCLTDGSLTIDLDVQLRSETTATSLFGSSASICTVRHMMLILLNAVDVRRAMFWIRVPFDACYDRRAPRFFLVSPLYLGAQEREKK